MISLFKNQNIGYVRSFRFLPDIKHFIAYLRYGDTWYFYNDIGPVVEEVIIDTEKDLMGERLLFYYSKINEE